MSLALLHKYKPFCYIYYDQRSIMTCLSKPACYRGNPYGHYTSPYTTPCSSLGDNCHLKKTSPTTDDQPNYHPKLRRVINQHVYQDLDNPFPITYPSEDDIQKSNLISMVLCNFFQNIRINSVVDQYNEKLPT